MTGWLSRLWKCGEPWGLVDSPTTEARGQVRSSALGYLGLLLVLSVLIVVLGRGEVMKVAGAYGWAETAGPYFQARHALLAYGVTPLVILSSLVLFLFPGALFVLLLGQARCWVQFLLMSFGASLLILVGVTTVAKLMVGPIDEIAPFLGMWLGCVQGAERFVQQQQLRVHGQRAGHRHPLPHAT